MEGVNITHRGNVGFVVAVTDRDPELGFRPTVVVFDSLGDVVIEDSDSTMIFDPRELLAIAGFVLDVVGPLD